MNKPMDFLKHAMKMLKATSRTFYLPISFLPPGLKESVTSAYLCMRAIDEIEDHPTFPAETKISLLQAISRILQERSSAAELRALFHPYRKALPEVSLRLGDWIRLAPPSIAPLVLNATSAMSEGMAFWVSRTWKMKTEEDLDQYTYCVAGRVGLLLSDLWHWFEGINADRDLSVAFGRGLQAVNILRNRSEDLARGADFFPEGWDFDDMFLYARRNLELGEAYMKGIKPGPVLTFCKIPLALAYGTLDVLAAGGQKLCRAEVAELVRRNISHSR